MKLFWYDSETSGISPDNHQMLTFAMVCTDLNLNVLGELYLKVRLLPHVTPEERALSINKLDPYTLIWHAEAIEEKDLCHKIVEFYNQHSSKEESNFWLAYNGGFDNKFLQCAFNRHEVELKMEKDFCVDPLLMCKEATKENKILTPELKDRNGKFYRSSKLVDVSKALNTAHVGDAHNALNDVHCMIKTTPKAYSKHTPEAALLSFLTNEKYHIGF